MTSGNGAQAMDDKLRTTDKPPQKLILGTAQFGSDYGIKHDGQPSISEIEKIARIAWDAGIRVIHTSWQYPFAGSEVFGEFWKIRKSIEDPRYFYDQNGRKGMALYMGDNIKMESPCDIYQLPVNVLQGKPTITNKCFEIHARSVFLQGLSLMDELPGWISDSASESIGLFQAMARMLDLYYHEAALGWVLGQDVIDKVIVGVNSAKQLEQLVKVKPLKWDYDFSIQDEMVLDPRRWPK